MITPRPLQTPPPRAPLTRLGRAAMGLATSRFELFEIELQEEKFRAINLLVIFAVSVSLAVAGILLLVAVLGVFLVRVAGYGAVAGLGVVLLIAAVGLIWQTKRKLLHGSLPFAETLSEFKKDASCLNAND